MRYVGFGCSWMYGSELEPIGNSWHEIKNNQHSKTFLGLLGENENHSDPGGSLKSMFYKFMNHQATANSDDIFYVFAFTHPSREGWYDSNDREWKNSTWIKSGTMQNNVDRFMGSYKDYVTHTWSPEYEEMNYISMVTAMLSTAKAKGFRHIGFNALQSPYMIKDPNMFWAGTSMEEQLRKDHLCEGGHPNESGHKWISGRVREFIDTAYPSLL